MSEKIIQAEPPTPVKVGDIFRNSWGYDQTNVDYYQAVRVTAQSVYLRAIASEQVPNTGGHMSCDVRPVPGKFLFLNEKVRVRRIKFFEGRPCCRMECGHAFRISPTSSAYSSWYH